MAWNAISDVNDGQSLGGSWIDEVRAAVAQLQTAIGASESPGVPPLADRIMSPAISSIADDTAMTLGVGTGVVRGLLVVVGNTAPAGHALVAFRTGDPSAHATVISSGGVTVDGGVGALGGTTGVDGRLTIHARTDQTWLQLENRTGSVRGYSFSFLAVSGTLTVVAWS
jgi:hypothetical protein